MGGLPFPLKKPTGKAGWAGVRYLNTAIIPWDVPGAIRFFIGLRLGAKTSLDLAPGGHTTSILSHVASILSHMASVLSHMFSIFCHIISILSPMGGIASMLC